MEIGSKLKNARNGKGITQEQAAELLGVSRQTISNWENNKSYLDRHASSNLTGAFNNAGNISADYGTDIDRDTDDYIIKKVPSILQEH